MARRVPDARFVRITGVARPTGVAGVARHTLLAVVALLALLALPALPPAPGPSEAVAGDRPFTFPSNIGLTGLLEIPTARTMGEDRFRSGYVRVDPYRWFFLGFSPWDWLEVGGRITEVDGVPGFTGSNSYGDVKDKALDLKVRFLKEGKYFPAVAAVIMDPHGTRIYAAQALVASKQVYPFDFTVGFGNGRLGEKPLPAANEGFRVEMISDPATWWRESNLFGGIQFAPSDRFALLAEYNPVRYHDQTRDPAQPVYFREPVPSRINVGARWKPVPWAELDLSWQRGDQWGAGVTIEFDVGKPFVPIYEPPYREAAETVPHPLEERIAAGLLACGFRDVVVRTDGMTLRVEARNERFFFTPAAFEAMLLVLAETGAGTAEYVRLAVTENGIPLAELDTTREAIEGLPVGFMATGALPKGSEIRTETWRTAAGPTAARRWIDVGLKPSLEMFLNDPSEFFTYRLGIAGWANAFPWRGGLLATGVEAYPLNTVSTSNVPLSIPVRSDVALYKKEGLALSRLMFDQVVKGAWGVHGRLAAGLLEVMYGGFDGELAWPVLGGHVLLGAGGSYVWKRDPDAPFGFTGDTYRTALAAARIDIARWDVALGVKAGRFLAGDTGASFSLSKFINGYTISAWYTITDTSIFSDPYNQGYRDKGVLMTIPLRMFTGRESKTVYTYKLAPWTRDTGQDVEHYRPLFDFIGRNVPPLLDRDRKTL